MPGKYDAFYNWLKNRPASETTLHLSFQQIEQILNDKLPESAHKHSAWWANNANTHTHAESWLDAGWRVEGHDLSAETVTFVRG